MNDLEVRIVKLDPFKAVCFHGFGPSPESVAFDKVKKWLAESRILEDEKPHRFFGFNNPDPAPGSPNYGYDVWITTDEAFQDPGEGEMISFQGGLYAVTGCKGVETIGPTWQQFVKWRETSPYQFAHDHQWLEEHLNLFAPMDELSLDLYMPIKA